MKQQELPQLERGLTFAEREPRTKLYAYLSQHSYAVPSKNVNGWAIDFTSDRGTAMKLREVFPVPLSLIKKLRRRCKPHRYSDGKVYWSWRYHPQGEQLENDQKPREMLALLDLMRGQNVK